MGPHPSTVLLPICLLRRLNKVLDIVENITLLALSTTPFDSGWQTEANAILVLMLLQNSLNLSESNCLPLSTVKVLGTLNLQIMFCQKNFFTNSDVIVARGLASIHLVKYSIATTASLFPPCDGGNGPTRSMPHLCRKQCFSFLEQINTAYAIFSIYVQFNFTPNKASEI